MAKRTMGRPDCALLIGIDRYLPNQIAGGVAYPSLRGCVGDALDLAAFLTRSQGVAEDRVTLLLSPDRKTEAATAAEATSNNLQVALGGLVESARPREQILIFYSGHGGRAATKYHELKGADGLDEVLVPMDIGRPGGDYLRDVELGHLVAEMIRRQLEVTLIIDSCHSGGTMRGPGGKPGAAPRGGHSIDYSHRPEPSLIAPREELLASWRKLVSAGTRALEPGSRWLPRAEGYVLFAACRAHELAFEFEFEEDRPRGALTYWLLEALHTLGAGLACQTYFDRASAKVRSFFPAQTPQLEGNRDRRLFGVDTVASSGSVTVLDVTDMRVLLNTGQAQGVRQAARFAVYPSGAATPGGAADRIALVEVTDYGAATSWARIVEATEGIEPGARATPVGLGCRRTTVTPEVLGNESGEALAEVGVEIDARASGFLRWTSGEDEADFQLAVSREGEYEIRDSRGAPIRIAAPALVAGEPGAAASVADRLVHLARFRNVRELFNHDSESPLANALEIELQALPEAANASDPLPSSSLVGETRPLTVRVEQILCLRVRNRAPQALNVAILDLRPEWSVRQIHPPEGSAAWVTIESDQEEMIRLRADLAEGYETGTDLLKVFATVEPTDFRWLELPPLGQDPESRSCRRGLADGHINEFFRLLAEEGPETRGLRPAAIPSAAWTIAQEEIRVLRG